MTPVERARAELSAAVVAERSTEETLRSAKLAFFGSSTDQSRKAVAAAENGVQTAKLTIEGAEHRVKEAQRTEAEAHASGQRTRLAELTAREVTRSERAAAILALLVDAERTAYALIAELERHMRDRADELHTRKSLAVAVGDPAPIRTMKNSTDLRYELQSMIKSTQIAEGRDGYSNGQVAAWLQPAAFATSTKVLRREASNA